MNHSFDIDHAEKYGVTEAVLIANFQHWITRNRANDENFKEGRTWTYNSVESFRKVFPYLSGNQIRRALDSLVTREVLVKGCFNTRASDRTTWFAFTDESVWLPSGSDLAKNTNGLAKNPNGFAKSAKSTNKTDINAVTEKHTAPSASVFDPCVFLVDTHGVNINVANDFLKIRKAKRTPATETALQGITDRAIAAGYSMNEALKICCERGWASFNADWLERRSTGGQLAIAGPGQSGMSAKTAATVANLNAFFGEN